MSVQCILYCMMYVTSEMPFLVDLIFLFGASCLLHVVLWRQLGGLAELAYFCDEVMCF